VADREGRAGQDGLLGEEEVPTLGEDVEAVDTHGCFWLFLAVLMLSVMNWCFGSD